MLSYFTHSRYKNFCFADIGKYENKQKMKNTTNNAELFYSTSPDNEITIATSNNSNKKREQHDKPHHQRNLSDKSTTSTDSKYSSDAMNSSNRRKIKHSRDVGTINDEQLRLNQHSSPEHQQHQQQQQSKPYFQQQNDIVYTDLLPPTTFYNQANTTSSTSSSSINIDVDRSVQKMKKGMKSIIKRANGLLPTNPLQAVAIRTPKPKAQTPTTPTNPSMRLDGGFMKQSESMEFPTSSSCNDSTTSVTNFGTPLQLDVSMDKIFSGNGISDDSELIEKMSLESGTTSLQKENRKHSRRPSQYSTNYDTQEQESLTIELDTDRDMLMKHENSLQELLLGQSSAATNTHNIYDQHIRLKTYSEANFLKLERLRQNYYNDKQKNEIAANQTQEKIRSLETKVKQLSGENQLLRTCVQSHEEDIVAFRKSITNLERYIQKSSQKSGKFKEYCYSLLAVLIGFVGMIIIFFSSIFKSMRLIKPSKRVRASSAATASDTLYEIQKKIEEKKRELEELAVQDQFVPIADERVSTPSKSDSRNSLTLQIPLAESPASPMSHIDYSSCISGSEDAPLAQTASPAEYSETNYSSSSDEDNGGSLIRWNIPQEDKEPNTTLPVQSKKIMDNLLMKHMTRRTFCVSDLPSFDKSPLSGNSGNRSIRTPLDDEEDIMKEAEQYQSLSKHFLLSPRGRNAATFESEGSAPSSRTETDESDQDADDEGSEDSDESDTEYSTKDIVTVDELEGSDINSSIQSNQSHSQEVTTTPGSKSQLDAWLQQVNNGDVMDIASSGSTFEAFNDMFTEFS
jgi:hypothetical protein